MANPFKAAARRAQPVRDLPVKSITTGQTISKWQSGKPQFTDWSTDKAVRDGLKVSTYVYACARVIAQSAASVPWKAIDPVTEKDVPRHPFEQLMRKPNLKISSNNLMERLAYHLVLGGNGIWSKIRSRGTVIELWPIGPDGISPIPDRAKFISGYEYNRDGIKETLKAEDVVHFSLVDPANPYWGLSPLQAAARVVDTDVESIRWNKVALQNRAVADGAFVFSHALSDTQYDEAREQIWEQHQGADNARMPWVLGAGATWQQMSLSPVEMDFIESRKMNRVEICSVYQVPPPMVGIYDDATLANIETSRKIFWLDGMTPFLMDLKDGVNLSLGPDFGNEVLMVPDLSRVEALKENYGDKVEAGHKLWVMGVPLNEVNRVLELGLADDIDGADIGYVPANVLPAGVEALPEPEPVEEEEPLLLPEPDGEQAAQVEHTKARYWKAFEQQREGYYRLTERKAAEVLEREAKAVVSAVAAGGLNDGVAAVRRSRSIWESLLEVLYNRIIEDFGTAIYDDATKSATAPHTKDFDVTDIAIRQWIQEWAGERATLLVASSIDDVKRVFANGVARNLTIDQISKQLREFYDRDIISRSYRLARTEVVGSSNYGALQGASQSGVMRKKSWISSRDKRVRQDHGKADSSTVNIDEDFIVGGERMAHPGDPKASGKQTIQCRCALQFTR
jgi:HK97 family phage portal protein